MKNLKKAIALLLAAVMILGLAACGGKTEATTAETPAETSTTAPAEEEKAEETAAPEETVPAKVAEIQKAGKLVVGTSADYPPYEFHTEINGEDTIVGFDMAIAGAIAEKMGVELEIVDMGFDGLLISLQKGDFDLVMAGLTPSEERKQVVDFTESFFTNKQMVIIRKDDADKITTTDDLAELKGGYQSGTVQEGIAKTYCKEENCIGLVKFNDLIMELKSGKLDAIFTNRLVASAYVSGNPDIIVQDVNIDYSDDGFAGAVEKDQEGYVEYLNGIIDELMADGSIDQYVSEACALAGAEE